MSPGELACQALLNCLIREVAAPEDQAWEDDGHLIIRDWCAAQGVREPEFNLGGGMAVGYARPDAPFGWAAYGRGLARLARDGETLRIEPGRAVTAYCGWYLTRVLDVKRSHGEAFAVVAFGLAGAYPWNISHHAF